MSAPAQASALRFALARLRRALSAGELRVLGLALLLAAAAATAVGQFAGRVASALARNSGEAIGADAVVTGKIAPSPELIAQWSALGLRTALITQFPSVAFNGEHSQLATVRAVTDGYPLRGQLQIAREPYGEAQPVSTAPPRGSVWVDARLWTALQLGAEPQLKLGAVDFKVAGVIVDEPGRGGAFAELAPALLLNAADVPATQLMGPGSRADYTLQLAGEAAALKQARSLALPPGLRFIRPEDSRPEIRDSQKRARQFLDLAVLATLLLCGAAIALSARQHAAQWRDEVALLKSLGATRAFLRRTLLWQLLLFGLAAALLGILLGLALQLGLARLAAPALGVQLPPTPWQPVPVALLLVELLLAGFALPPLLAALEASPVRVFQRSAEVRTSPWLAPLAALLCTGLAGALLVSDLTLLGIVALGAGLSCGVLALLAWLLVRLLARTRRAGLAWRFGLGNIARRGAASIAQVVALGIALLALLLVTVVREELLASWQNRLPPRTPNQFLINIQPAQVEPLRAFFAAHGYTELKLWPMVRGRLTAINDQPVTADSFNDPETRRWINREFNLSWTESFGDDNTLLQGQWWDASARGKPLLSATDYAFERLHLKLGDRLTLDVAGTPYTVEVHNERKVNWDSFRPNFFLVTPPGVLDGAGATQWITSFYLPVENRALLRELVQAFPNVTAIDLEASLNQVRSIMNRIVRALALILGFALVAGLVVMLAVIEGSRAERRRETAVLRALGASSRVILQGLVAEYAALGLIAGTVAAAAAQALAWSLARWVFEIPFGLQPGLWLLSALSGCALVTATGWLSLRGTLRTSPRVVLAG